MDTMLIINILLALAIYKFVLVPVHALLSAVCLRGLRTLHQRINGNAGSQS
ncbi:MULTISPECIES: hypothetical protein [unclassified Shewanella]|uniref:hypothetical protein n=1 Tax=unclassified Shewanella TaxID=196818 RepID=UPI0021DB08D7|nr:MULTISPECIES: hypothetical protein [unclassified Shewanella]MCU8036402.1 hypothetical protein [Shewanella sp. SM71]MCU8075802.1 hypothetical protein [Shewanella sp. SM29]MCU8098348.1 hypothetical protein [Shewanella sp. SM102]